MDRNNVILFAPSSYCLRGWVSLLGAVLLLMAYIFDFSSTTKLFISLIAFFWGGELFIRGALLELRKLYIGFNVFVILSAASAFLLGIFNNLHDDVSIPVEGIALIMPLLFAVADFIKYFELKHIGHSKRFMESLDGFIAKSVFKIEEDGSTKKIFAAEVELDDLLLIKNGERLAVDCRLTKGSTIVDESLLTGNITLAAKQPGDLVLAGSINKGSQVQAQAVSLKDSSKIAFILEEVKKSETKKMILPSMLEVYAFKVLAFFFALALLQFAVGAVIEPNRIFYWFLVSLLLLVFSGPVIYMAAVLLPVFFTYRNAAKSGIYIQNGHALNILKNSTAIFIDKTGTLTSGRLEVAEIAAAPGVKEADVVKAAFTAQSSADNIFASALKEYARKHKITASKLTSIELHPSFGTVVKDAKNTIIAGRRNWLEDKGVENLPEVEETKRTVFFVAKNGKYLGAVYFKDRLRANAKNTISFLKSLGKKVCLMSGDNAGAAGAAAKMSGIEEYYGNMYPQDKAAKIAAASNMGETTVMVGDGFNDILALLQAGAGIAFSSANNVFSSWVDIIIKDRDFAAFKRVFDFEACRAAVIRQNIYVSILAGVFLFWQAIGTEGSLQWYKLVLAALLTIFVIIVNSARIKHG